jgi:hypothetical protein
LPDNENIKGLVFFIPGFGLDSNDEYIMKFRTRVADNYSLGCVSVSYHAKNIYYGKENARLGFDIEDIERLNEFLRFYGYNPDYSSVNEGISILDQAIDKFGKAEEPFIHLTAQIDFGDEKTDYQNFGVMQALDHICVLYDLHTRRSLDWNGHIIAIGSSHGGYIANLLSKFAPNTLTAVFDNSSYAVPPLAYVMTREMRSPFFSPFVMATKNIKFLCSIKSGWTTNSLSSNYYHDDARKIRSFLYEEDIKKMAELGKNKTQYRFYHSKYDSHIANVYEKIAMADLLKKYGFDTKIYLIDHCDVDGRFIKTADHGMNLSLQMMFDKLYPDVTPKDKCSDISLRSLIVYEGINGDYVLKYESDEIIPRFVRH